MLVVDVDGVWRWGLDIFLLRNISIFFLSLSGRRFNLYCLKESSNHSYLEIRKRVKGKQYRPRSDVT